MSNGSWTDIEDVYVHTAPRGVKECVLGSSVIWGFCFRGPVVVGTALNTAGSPRTWATADVISLASGLQKLSNIVLFFSVYFPTVCSQLPRNPSVISYDKELILVVQTDLGLISNGAIWAFIQFVYRSSSPTSHTWLSMSVLISP